MKKITWNKNHYLIDGKPAFLISGELHYFRTPSEDWERRLVLFKEAGGNCVATYIPWILHEPAEGDIRFSDVSYRDLEGFLNLCKKLDIYVIARPGPYQYSELKHYGLPGWLCENYPEIRARTVNNQEFSQSLVSYMHPVFLQKVYIWFKAVCPIIAANSVQNGGAIAFTQFDNELIGIHEWESGWDYNMEGMEIGNKGGAYSEFLSGKYGEICRLNNAYGADYKNFENVLPADFTSFESVKSQIAERDYRDYYFERVAQYAQTLVGWMKEFGINTPFIHNSANGDMNTYFLETCKKLGNDFLLGSDHYYNLNMDWDQNNPTPKYAVKSFISCEILKFLGYPPSVFELPGGSCSDWPPITPEDLSCCYYTNLAFGMKGLNYYVYTGGINRENTGWTSEIYDYGAAISADGQIRPIYYTLSEFGNFLKNNTWLASGHRKTDIAIGLDTAYQRARRISYGQSRPGKVHVNKAWDTMSKGLIISSLCASISPEITDISCDDMLNCKKPLFFAPAYTLSGKNQRNLTEFVKRGGNLVLVTNFPEADENLNPCTILRDFAGAFHIEYRNTVSHNISFFDIKNLYVNGSLYVDTCPSGDLKILAKVEGTGEVCAWKKNFENGGSIIWFGISWMHTMNEHRRMMENLVSESRETNKFIECSNMNIWSSLWNGVNEFEDKYMLFAMNLFSAPMKADITVNIPAKGKIPFNNLEFKPMEVKKLGFAL